MTCKVLLGQIPVQIDEPVPGLSMITIGQENRLTELQSAVSKPQEL